MPTSSNSNLLVSASPSTETEVVGLLSRLEIYLPYSLPLFRRLQFYLAHLPDRANLPHAQIFEASAQHIGGHRAIPRPSENGQSSLRDENVGDGGSETGTRFPWLAAHVDLGRSPETQVWIFANWECPDQEDRPSMHLRPPSDSVESEARQSLLQSCLKFIYTHCVPLMHPTIRTSSNSVKKLHSNHHPYSPSAVLFGSCNLTVRSLIPTSAVRRIDAACLKYIIPSISFEDTSPSPTPNTRDNLPPGYWYGVLRQPQDLQLALDRTDIPRKIETLALLPSRAVFCGDEPDPVAWGFLGPDGSLTSLHTEPQHRGKNLAVLLARELLRMQREHFRTPTNVESEILRTESGSGWGHADIREDNLGSRRVMEKVGGRAMWVDYWVETELERLFGKGGLWGVA